MEFVTPNGHDNKHLLFSFLGGVGGGDSHHIRNHILRKVHWSKKNKNVN